MSTDLTAREDALGRNKALLRLWISKTGMKQIALSVIWLLIPLFFPLVWHPNLHWVWFYSNTAFLLKAGFALRCYSQSFASKKNRDKIGLRNCFWKQLRTFRVFEVLWHVLYSYIVKMKYYFLKSQILQAVFQVNDFHRKYILNII